MTNEEVIEELLSRKVSMSMCISVDDYMKSNMAIEKAIESLQENTKLKVEIEQLLKNRDADRKYYSNEIQSLIKNQKYEVEKLKGELKSEREWRHNTRIELLDRNKEIESLKEENAELKKIIPKMCETCKFEDLSGTEEPCENCKHCSNWTIKGGVE